MSECKHEHFVIKQVMDFKFYVCMDCGAQSKLPFDSPAVKIAEELNK